jgi:hypothetical protein
MKVTIYNLDTGKEVTKRIKGTELFARFHGFGKKLEVVSVSFYSELEEICINVQKRRVK